MSDLFPRGADSVVIVLPFHHSGESEEDERANPYGATAGHDSQGQQLLAQMILHSRRGTD